MRIIPSRPQIIIIGSILVSTRQSPALKLWSLPPKSSCKKYLSIAEVRAKSLEFPVISFADFAILQDQRLFHFLSYDASSNRWQL